MALNPRITDWAGRVVWLFDDSYNPMDSEMTVAWTQTYGPEVVWLKTTSSEDVAFIMPDLSESEFGYLAFEVTVDNGYGTMVFPSVNEPIRSREEDATVVALQQLQQAFARATARIEEARLALRGESPR